MLILKIPIFFYYRQKIYIDYISYCIVGIVQTNVFEMCLLRISDSNDLFGSCQGYTFIFYLHVI